MSTIKSYAVGNGDTYYICHNSSNFTIIDCFLSELNKERIVKDIHHAHLGKEVTRFISTHPDQDHIQGLKYLDENIDIRNFYCIDNKVTKKEITDDFKYYCSLRDSEKAFNIYKGCLRKWMNDKDETRDSSGINILWPDTSNEHFIEALKLAESGGSPNNTSAIIKYALKDGVTALWMGDLETDFMEKIEEHVEWEPIDILFAPHHGRDSGKVPVSILKKLQPKLIIIGEAPSENLNYYQGYNTISQNSAGDLTFECVTNKVHIYVSNPDYSVKFLSYEYIAGNDYYLGTLNL